MTTKKQAATILILMLAGLMGLANAQMSHTIKAQVPFNFVANGKTMPAGECVITASNDGQVTLSIRSGNQHTYSVSIPDEPTNASKKPALVFHRYGDRYFLAGIRGERGMGYQLPASRLESELQARNVAGQVFTLLASAR